MRVERKVVSEPQNRGDDPEKPTAAAITSQELLGGARLLQIEHNGEIYTLRITRNDRLILTK
jgi:hemin uptake protein HemP